MDDIQRQDTKLFWQEAAAPGRIFFSLILVVFTVFMVGRNLGIAMQLAGLLAVGVGHALTSYNASIERRWHSPHFHELWNRCRDRLSRFKEVLGQMRKEQLADLHEMPKTIESVGGSLYAALRRADMIAHEVMLTEKDLHNVPPTYGTLSHDAQAKELYRIADKNIAEYRMQFAGVMAGVQRAEAQAAVYATTLDSLRMKMIGHRLVGRSAELSTMDFLTALGEAKLQLEAIDKALDELDFSSMPTVVVQPPPAPVDAMQDHRLGGGPPR